MLNVVIAGCSEATEDSNLLVATCCCGSAVAVMDEVHLDKLYECKS